MKTKIVAINSSKLTNWSKFAKLTNNTRGMGWLLKTLPYVQMLAVLENSSPDEVNLILFAMPKWVLKDADIVMAALRVANSFVVMEIVKGIDEYLFDNKDVMSLAISKNDKAFLYASDKLKNTVSVAKIAMSQYWKHIGNVPSDFPYNKEIQALVAAGLKSETGSKYSNIPDIPAIYKWAEVLEEINRIKEETTA